jgi:hypothetical protein
MSDVIENTAPVVTAPAKVRQMAFTILEDGTIQATFGDNVAPATLNPSAVPEAVQLAAIAEGLISRTRSYIGRLEGNDRTPEKMREQCLIGFNNLLQGTWKLERGQGGGSTEYTIEVRAALLFRQLKAKAKGEDCADTLETVAGMWAGFTDDQKKQVKALPRYQQALATVKAEAAAAKAEKLAKKADADEADSPF